MVADTWYELDVTSLVSGGGVVSLRDESSSGNGAFYASKEHTGGFAPELVITLSEPPPPTEITVTPSDDATVKEASPSAVFGSASSLEIDANTDKGFLLRFDVSGIGASSVANATLRLYNTNFSPFGGEFHIVTDTAWSEGTVTWDTAPAGDGGLLGSLGTVQPGNWYTLDVTPLVSGDGVVSVRVESPHPDGAFYASKEHSSGFTPELVITLGDPPPVITLTPSDDATVKEASPSAVFGSASSLEIDANSDKSFLLRFDVIGIGPSSVSSATLRLYNTNFSPFGGELHIVTDTAWSENSVTWDTAPAGDGELLGSLSTVQPGNWYTLDVTSLVSGDGVVSIRVDSPHPDGAFYASKEHSSGFAPELVIDLN